MKTFHVLFATILWGDDNDTRLVLISLRSIMGEETVPKQGHLIYSEPHMTFSTNWCEILCNPTNTSSHSLSLILALFLLLLLLLNLSPLSFLSSSVLPLVLAQTLAFIVSLQIKKGLHFFYMIQLSLICSEWITQCVTHGVTDHVFSWIFPFFWFPQAFLKILAKNCYRKCHYRMSIQVML